ncbi:hypothetical protein AWM75_03645 [Aerococcus urinaehominis]|uniref:SseB protein N-terminal domain-containing protein n=1 Tax=Aerococcus urinaehominis TaxID=128944 RepID=A0A0X8FKT7_9LACT|nr:SseB family protein [Aerococcus urinaehominis]AMB99152.1 hypothetical protein AWM75_03645 [Aerococcus urinaehominis]SDM05477.1 SseB protein N-terminal domain-containing protein [Aerococcus urinaehominis]
MHNKDLIAALASYQNKVDHQTTLAVLNQARHADLYVVEKKRSQASSAHLLTLTSPDGHPYIACFSSKAAGENFSQADSQLRIMSFDQLANIIIGQPGKVNGFIIDPHKYNAKFNKEIIKQMLANL